jgi:hypothetical protein
MHGYHLTLDAEILLRVPFGGYDRGSAAGLAVVIGDQLGLIVGEAIQTFERGRPRLAGADRSSLAAAHRWDC